MEREAGLKSAHRPRRDCPRHRVSVLPRHCLSSRARAGRTTLFSGTTRLSGFARQSSHGALEDQLKVTCPPGARRAGGKDLDETPAVPSILLDDPVIVLFRLVGGPARLQLHLDELVLVPLHGSPFRSECG